VSRDRSPSIGDVGLVGIRRRIAPGVTGDGTDEKTEDRYEAGGSELPP
jgi:hypothetical protein